MERNQAFDTIIFGVSYESDNLGVNALGIGAASVIFKANSNCKIAAITLGQKTNKKYIIPTDNGDVSVELIYFKKEQYLIALLEAILFRLFKVQLNSRLTGLIKNASTIYNVNEGDSFSDIYGLKRLLRHYIDSKLALIWKKPLIFLPQTIGPFKTKIGKYLSKDILVKSKKIYVRDIKANAYLKELNIQSKLVFDLAVYMKPKESDISIPPKSIGININGLMYLNRYGSMKGQFSNYPKLLIDLVNQLIKNNWNIIFIPHTYNTTNPCEEDDLVSTLDFCKKNKLTENKQVTIITKQFDAQEIKFILSQLDYFIGSRMHSCIGAMSSNIPTFALAYSYKFHGTFEMFQQGDSLFEVNMISNEQTIEVIDKITSRIDKREISAKKLEEVNNHAYLNLND